MNIIVHIMFSYKMRRIIRREAGVKLNLLGFMYGNVLPDLSPSFNGVPHNLHGSLNYLIDSALALLDRGNLNSRHQSYGYSRDFGVITHYLADFFCYPHQEYYSKGFKDHGIYEFVMIARYKKGLKDYIRKFSGTYHHLEPHEFSGWIRERHNKYKQQVVSCENDISHALYAGSMIGRSMLLHLLEQSEEACMEQSAAATEDSPARKPLPKKNPAPEAAESVPCVHGI